MTSLEEPVLHALSLQPRTARAGETVRIAFRTRNIGIVPSPPGTVVFALGDGLEPLDGVEVPVEPVAPGEDVVAAVRAHVVAPADDRTEIAVGAALHLPDGVLGTNACTLVVRSRAVLDGPASGTFVEQIDADTVRVRAVVTNEGDGPACAVRIVVPAPLGCVRADGDAAGLLEVSRLEPGQNAEIVFDARIAEPVAEVRADDAEVSFGDGRRVALPAREVVTLTAVLEAPRVVATPSRRSVGLATDVTNAGWADARDVRVRVLLPAPLLLVEGSVEVDGVPLGGVPAGGRRPRRRAGRASGSDVARIERDGAAHAVVVAAVPARSTVRVTLAAAFPAGFPGGTIAVGIDGRHVEVPFVPQQLRDVRVRFLDVPRFVSPGETACMRAAVLNAGDIAEHLTVGIRADRCAGGAADAGIATEPGMANASKVVVEPGAAVTTDLTLCVPDDVRDGMKFRAAAIVSGADGLGATAECSLLVRDRAWISVDEPPVRSDGRVSYTIRNGGSTIARGVAAVFGDARLPVGDLAAGASTVCAVDESLAAGGGTLVHARGDALVLPRLDDRLPARVHARLDVPERVVAGAAFAVRLDLDAEDDVDRLTIRVPALDGLQYADGSASLDGHTLLDRRAVATQPACSPFRGDGLALRGVRAGTRLTARWLLIADSQGPDTSRSGGEQTRNAQTRGQQTFVRATIDSDGQERDVTSTGIAVRERDVFAARRTGLPYHVEASILPAPVLMASSPWATPTDAAQATAPPLGTATSDAVPSVAESGEAGGERLRALPLRYALRLDRRRTEEIARLLPGTYTDGLVAHLFALRFFFPDGLIPRDDALAAALESVERAMRDTFDRLYVKLRIPGFDVSSDDLEDDSLRTALIVLHEQLLAAACADPAGDTGGFERERERLRRALPACAEASYGAPAVLRSLVGLIPAAHDDDPRFGAALAAYANLLDGALSRYEGLPLELFDDALAHGRDGALDDARDRVLAALQQHVRPLEAAC